MFTKRNGLRKWLAFLLAAVLIVSGCLVPAKDAAAGLYSPNEADVDMNDGTITFTLSAKRRTSSTFFRTVGYIITEEDEPGNYLTAEQKSHYFYIPGTGHDNRVYDIANCRCESDDRVDGDTIYTTFTICRNCVAHACSRGEEYIDFDRIYANGGYIYLQGIIDVYVSGRLKATCDDYWKVKKLGVFGTGTLGDIQKRYNMKVKYKPSAATVTVRQWIYDKESGQFIPVSSQNAENRVSSYNASGYTGSNWPVGGTFSCNSTYLPDTLQYDGKTYYLYRTHWSRLEDEEQVYSNGTYRPPKRKLKNRYHPIRESEAWASDCDRIRTRQGLQTNTKHPRSFYPVRYGGIEVVGCYKLASQKKNEETEDGSEYESDDEGAYGVIQADYRDFEEYDSTEGIPTTETQYVNVFTKEYLYKFSHNRVSGTNYYPELYDEWYPDGNGNLYPVPRTRSVARSYSYSYITDLAVYKITSSTVENYSLPNGAVTIPVSAAYIPPEVQVSTTGTHYSDPPGVGTYHVGEISCWNDSLTFNGQVIMDGATYTTSTPTPGVIPEPGESGRDVLYGFNYLIDGEKENGEFPSSGYVIYTLVASVGSHAATKIMQIEDINNVVIHTPTVCDATIEDVKYYNQEIIPNRDNANLILDRSFRVHVPSMGYHTDLQGYGERDYIRYIQSREVKFPFDVYRDNVYYAADTWIELYADYTSFYLPIWVDEGFYTVDFRARTINCDANEGLECTEILANTMKENYVAEDSVDVNVSGRLYGLEIYDISDYPVWEKVFRQSDSIKKTGFTYKVGDYDQNGNATSHHSKYTFPLVNGSHPWFANIGTIGTGYLVRFNLTTIGNLYDTDDFISIYPTFHYVSYDGLQRQEADVYYTETMNGKKEYLVGIGSEKDETNLHTMRFGDPYTAVTDAEMELKAYLTGKTVDTLKGESAEVYTFNKIKIPETMRVYTGENYTPTGSVPAGVNPDKVAASMQKWYGEYYLPSDIHVLPKGFDLKSYIEANHGVDFNEDIWLKDGYLVVNLNIVTVQDGFQELSYTNSDNEAEGYCNMWKLQNFQYEKRDFQNNRFRFEDGDFLMIDLKASAKKDYGSHGTH